MCTLVGSSPGKKCGFGGRCRGRDVFFRADSGTRLAWKERQAEDPALEGGAHSKDPRIGLYRFCWQGESREAKKRRAGITYASGTLGAQRSGGRAVVAIYGGRLRAGGNKKLWPWSGYSNVMHLVSSLRGSCAGCVS